MGCGSASRAPFGEGTQPRRIANDDAGPLPAQDAGVLQLGQRALQTGPPHVDYFARRGGQEVTLSKRKGESITFAKQPPLGGVGGNPHVFLLLEDGAGNPIGDHFAKPGSNDRVWNSHEKLAQRAPEVRVHVIPNATHYETASSTAVTDVAIPFLDGYPQSAGLAHRGELL